MDKASVEQWLDELRACRSGLYQKDFLLTWEQIAGRAYGRSCLTARDARGDVEGRTSPPASSTAAWRSRTSATSRRARASPSPAPANLLGLTVQDFDEGKSQVAHGETVRETANMISFLTEAIGIRDDIFIGEGHEYMHEVAAARRGGLPRGRAAAAAGGDQPAVRPRPPHAVDGRPAAPAADLRLAEDAARARRSR